MANFDLLTPVQQGLGIRQQRDKSQLQRQLQLMELDDQRKGALFQDARTVNSFLKSGQPEQALNVLSNRLSLIEQIGGDPSDTMEVANFIAQGDLQGATNLLDAVEEAGVQSGFLEGPEITTDSVQSSKIFDDGTVLQVMKGGGRRVTSPSGEVLTGDAAREAIKSANQKVQDRKIALKRLDQKIKREQSKEGILTDQQRLNQSQNIKRIGLLSDTATGRSSAIKKAIKFRDALKEGSAFSGAGRRAAQFIPGVFTSQGQFDEEFNAFAEVAARQQLKASGETRPTDADVQGMKNAMFGIGRDETVNVQLLDDFIKDQQAQNNELDQLIEATNSGDLSSFTFSGNQPQPSEVIQTFNFDAQGNLIQ